MVFRSSDYQTLCSSVIDLQVNERKRRQQSCSRPMISTCDKRDHLMEKSLFQEGFILLLWAQNNTVVLPNM